MEMTMTVDSTAASFAQEVDAAAAALIEAVSAEPGTWPAWELKIRARNGWSDGAMNVALASLLADGTLSADGDRVSLSA